MREVAVLVGGEGRRLKSVVPDIPKPMAEVGGRPFLAYLIEYLRDWGIPRVILCVGYKAECVQDYFGDGSRFGLRIEYSREKTPLGTGGALKQAVSLIEGDSFLALNGDSFFSLNIKRFIEFYRDHQARAALALTPVSDTARYGTVECDPEFRVTAFREKRSGIERGLINTGIYIFAKDVFSDVPAGKISLETSVLPRLIGNGFYAFYQEGFFIDIGIPCDYSGLCNDPDRFFGLIRRAGKAL